MKLTFLVIIGFLLSSQLVQAQDWSNDFSEAKQLSLEKDLPILLVFSGSDWCAPCIKLEKNVWMSEYFINYAPEHYILLKADFPKRKQNALSLEKQRENDELAKQFNPNGHFPPCCSSK